MSRRQSPRRLTISSVLLCRFSEALAISRERGGLPQGGLSQALGSPPPLAAPLSASWEGARSNWPSSGWGGTLGDLVPAGSGGASQTRHSERLIAVVL